MDQRLIDIHASLTGCLRLLEAATREQPPAAAQGYTRLAASQQQMHRELKIEIQSLQERVQKTEKAIFDIERGVSAKQKRVRRAAAASNADELIAKMVKKQRKGVKHA